jgi:hypothetical protein
MRRFMRSLGANLAMRRSDLIALSVLGLVTLLLYAEVIEGSKGLLVFPDNAQQTVAWYAYANRAFHDGVLPLWDPYQFAGHSFVGEAQTGVFYPLNYAFFAAVGDQLGAKGISAFLLGHVLLAGLFQYAFLRVLRLPPVGALAGAIAFALGGFLFHRITGQANIFMSAVWLPLAFLFFHQALHRSLLFAPLAGAAVAVSLLAGHIQPPALACISLVLYAGWFALANRGREELLRAAAALGIALAVTAGLSAVQLLPSLEYQDHAYRFVGDRPPFDAATRLPYEVVGYHYLLEPRDLGGFLSPVFGDVDDGRPYIGIVTLLLAGVGAALTSRRIVGFWVLLFVLALVYSLGHHGGLHHLAYLTVPLLDKLREPVRALYIVHFALSVLAAYGVAALAARGERSQAPSPERRWRGLPLVVAGGGAIVAVATSIDAQPAGSDTEGLITAVALALLAGGLIAAWGVGGLAARVAAPLCVAALCLDLVPSGWQTLPEDTYDGTSRFSPDAYYLPTPVTEYFRANRGVYRIDNAERALPVNVGDFEGFQLVSGYGATMHKSLYDLFQAPGSASRTPDLLNIRYAVTTQPVRGWPLVMTAGVQRLHENPDPHPRAWVSHRWEIAPDRSAALTRALEPGFDHRRDVVLEESPGTGSSGEAEPREATVLSYEPTRIEIEARAARPGLLVASEIWYPGWEATVDGRPAPVLRADGLTRAIPVPAGAHRVVMTYRPTHWTLALVLTFVSLVLVLVSSILALLRQRQGRLRGA